MCVRKDHNEICTGPCPGIFPRDINFPRHVGECIPNALFSGNSEQGEGLPWEVSRRLGMKGIGREGMMCDRNDPLLVLGGEVDQTRCHLLMELGTKLKAGKRGVEALVGGHGLD